MANYIIDIPDDRVCDYVGSTHLLMPYTRGEHKKHYDTGLNLTPYTEPDRNAIEDEVWEFAWEVLQLDLPVFRKIFGYDTDKMDYRDYKYKYEAWQKRKDDIRVGDEVEYKCGGLIRFVVTGIYGKYAVGFKDEDDDIDVGDYCDIKYLRKTGRHFDEVEALLKKMRGEE